MGPGPTAAPKGVGGWGEGETLWIHSLWPLRGQTHVSFFSLQSCTKLKQYPPESHAETRSVHKPREGGVIISVLSASMENTKRSDPCTRLNGTNT